MVSSVNGAVASTASWRRPRSTPSGGGVIAGGSGVAGGSAAAGNTPSPSVLTAFSSTDGDFSRSELASALAASRADQRGGYSSTAGGAGPSGLGSIADLYCDSD